MDGDPRGNYYHLMEKYTNTYAAGLGLGGAYGHRWEPVTSQELLRWDAIIIRDAIFGGSQGAIYRRFKPGCSKFDPATTDAMTEQRFLQIKRVVKLNDNNVSPRKGQPGYDPTFKYELVARTLIANTNAVSKRAGVEIVVQTKQHLRTKGMGRRARG